MLPNELLDLPAERSAAEPGVVLLHRGKLADGVVFVETGRVELGLMDGEGLTHLLGTVEGPFWLEASAAILGRPSLVDVVTETRVKMRRLALPSFRLWLGSLPESAQTLLRDIATAHWQQSELAVSRLAKDAEARCAEWLLRHAQTSAQGSVAVMLQQRKRLIAAQLGIAPETLSRVLRHLRERSLISGSGRVVNLVDPSGLRSLAGV
ncbi:MAG: Crp/Fnr family transcriptional regulator [Rhodoferax sp.]|nr:Crp/Fnr family transcriptional regulator [Rhodoferax sp.]MCB2005705.1 Crp/Fnr family transcriptional regulator [Rhodoferax sp.]MCB2030988.1 Crp/Fnr family transcriptional regulator [Rhodoferax sp.]MCW5631068.1 Crp/Fnr family transcriptional regulator [Rhodoferax sp.]